MGMTLTELQKMNQGIYALLVIDVQQGLFKKSTHIYREAELLDNINTLVDRAHLNGVPVLYIQHSDSINLVKGSLNWQLHPDLHPQHADIIIHKQHGNAFEDTNLENMLRVKNVTSLVVMGLVTNGCVKATCLGARQLGYRVILISDGHSSYSKDASRLIEEWNQKLKAQGCELKAVSEIDFAKYGE